MTEENDNNEELALERHEEEVAGVSKSWRGAGSVRARKRVDSVRERQTVPREREELTFERVPATEDDSGKIETLPDGSVSIPVYEEELVVTKRTVLKERVIVSKKTVTERERVTATLRKERVEVEGDRGVVVEDERAAPFASRPEAPGFVETRPFFLTSEFVAFMLMVTGVIVATASGALRVWVGVALAVAAVVAYLLSRGFAKAYSPSHGWDPREEIGRRVSRR